MDFQKIKDTLKETFQRSLVSLILYLIQYIVEEKAIVGVIQRASGQLKQEKSQEESPSQRR
jgi:hypothetical protein